MTQYRIRRCDGNRSAWLLCRMNLDGTEATAFGSYRTALSIDALLERAQHLTPAPTDSVELCYSKGDA